MRYINKSTLLTIYGKCLMLASIALLLAFGASIPAYASESDLSLVSDTETSVSDTEITASDTHSDKIYTVTEINDSEQLANLEPFEVARRASSQDTEVLIQYLKDNNLLTVTATITSSDGEILGEKELRVAWDCTNNSTLGANVAVCGEYTETGTILLPDNYQWGEDVINTLKLTVIVYEPEPIEIVKLNSHEDDFNMAFSLAQGTDIDAFLDEASLQQACNCKDAAGNVYLCPIVYHTETIRTDELGIYYITATFEAPDNCQFSDELNIPTYSIPVSVQDPEQPRLDVSYIGTFTEFIYFPWTTSGIDLSTIEVWVSENEGEWRMMELYDEVQIHSNNLEIDPYMMVAGNSYRVQVKYEGGQTGIASFTYEGSTLTDKGYIEGDRDGGDTDGNPPNDSETDEDANNSETTTTAPTPEKEIDTTVENPTPNAVIPQNTGSEVVISETVISEVASTEAVISESDSSAEAASNESNSIGNKEIAEVPSIERKEPYLLGREISLMLENLGSARFSAETIMLDIPADAITALGLNDTDQLLVTILPLENNSFSIEILKNDVAVTTVPSMQISLPYEPAENAAPVLVNEAGREVATGDYKPDMGLVTFTISETGTFHIKEVKAASQDSFTVKTLTAPENSVPDKENDNSVFRLIPIAAAVIICFATVTIILFKKKRRR